MASSFSQNFVLIKQWQLQKHKELKKILEMEAAGGFFMIVFTILALIFFNTSLKEWYISFINQDVIIGIGRHIASIDLKSFSDEVLLVLFFALISMELKRDLGQEILEQKNQILLSAAATLGGMICPAIIYTIFNWGNSITSAGWAIPMSTDTAFAISVLLLLGRGLPRSVKVFMLALAVFDDFASILVVALFFSGEIHFIPLLGAIFVCFVMLLFNKANIVAKYPYLVATIALFFLLHYAGLQTILAGVVLGLAIPIADNDNVEKYPLKELLESIQPVVSFFVLPLFAFVNAGIDILDVTNRDLTNNVTLGVFFGLFFGKQIGIFGTAYLLIKLNLAKMPRKLDFKLLYGVSIIGGIGFTMSIFLNNLTFINNESLGQDAITGILMSSLLAAFYGCVYFYFLIRYRKKQKKLKQLMEELARQ